MNLQLPRLIFRAQSTKRVCTQEVNKPLPDNHLFHCNMFACSIERPNVAETINIMKDVPLNITYYKIQLQGIAEDYEQLNK